MRSYFLQKRTDSDIDGCAKNIRQYMIIVLILQTAFNTSNSLSSVPSLSAPLPALVLSNSARGDYSAICLRL